MDTCESGEIEDDSSLEMLNAVGIKARSVKRGLKVVMNNKLNKPRTYLFEKDRYIYNDLLRRSGAIVFSSSLGGEYSYEDEKYQNGFFTKGIIEALTTNNADTNKDGIISTDELREYVSKKVAEISENKQHPTIDRDNIYCKFGFPKVTNK